VCFDVDSTVCTDEGIDELAAFCGAGEAVAALTTRAMGGSVPFQDALASRLDLIRPSAATLASFLAAHPPRLSPGIAALVAALHAKGKDVYLVSGGFTQMINPVADLLHIPRDRVFANTLLFDAATGAYSGFDTKAFTCRSGGKAAAIAHLKSLHDYTPLVMIGDGATDLEARAPGGAEMFIGYGGVAKRAVVVAGADWFVTSFDPLIQELQ
jgi:phosphoserine phosphatase